MRKVSFTLDDAQLETLDRISRSLFPEPNRSMTLRVVLDAFDGNSDATQALWAALLRCFHEMCEPPGFDDAIEGIMRAHGKEPGGKLPGKPY